MQSWAWLLGGVALGYLMLDWGQGLPLINQLRKHIDPDKFAFFSVLAALMIHAALKVF